jgi:hypothetical protein
MIGNMSGYLYTFSLLALEIPLKIFQENKKRKIHPVTFWQERFHPGHFKHFQGRSGGIDRAGN